MSARQHKKPGILYRVFFKDPDKYRQDEEPEWQMDPIEEWLQGEIPATMAVQASNSNNEHEADFYFEPPIQQHTPQERPFGAAPTLKRWVKLTIASESIHADVELTMFPIDIGSVQSSIQLNDKNISPRHAVMDLHNGILTITDTHSQNGVSIGSTWLNPGEPYTVNSGDTILIGRTRITVLDYAGRGMAGSLPTQSDKVTGTPPNVDVISQEDMLEAMGVEIPASLENMEGPTPQEELVDESIENEEPEAVPIDEPEAVPIDEPEPEPAPEFVPELESEPMLEPEPINNAATLKKLMEEPTATLFRAVLGMEEPEPEIETEPPIEDETSTSEDKPSQEEPLPSEILTAEDNISETTPEPKQESINTPEPQKEPESTKPLTTPIEEQTIEEYMESLLNSPHDMAAEALNPNLSQVMANEKPPQANENPLEDEIPENLSPEDFIEALMQKSINRTPPSWRSKDQEPPKKDEPSSPVIKTCPKCSTANNDEDKFCGSCGTSLDTAPPPITVKAFCGHCGAKNVHKIKFCGECGYKLT